MARNMSLSMVLIAIAVFTCERMPAVEAHSWLECTDYTMTADSPSAKVWQPSSCKAKARCSERQTSAGFGVDTGMNFLSATQCQCSKDKSHIPKAVYKPGQRVCLTYPAKTHVAAPCTNPYIPDNGVTISRTAAGANDDSFVKQYEHLNGKHEKGQIDYKGFQNCPDFCKNQDKAMCTMCFDLEQDIPHGEYAFRWVWAFNSPSESYTTCWDAVVSTSGNQTAPSPAKRN